MLVARLLGFLPAPLLVILGWLLGFISIIFLGKRNQVIARNIKMCFPESSSLWRLKVRFFHHALLGRFVIDHSLLLSASAKRIKRIIRIRGLENLTKHKDKPVILMVPHFLGLDQGVVRVGLEKALSAPYSPQRNPASDELVNLARTKIAKDNVRLISNYDPALLKTCIKDLSNGRTLYYLCDLDIRGRGKSIFVPFLGVKDVSTQTALPRLAKLTNAIVVPCITIVRPFGGYTVEICEALKDFPSSDVKADTSHFNEFIAGFVRKYPSQYYWPHRRFKTRPPGESNPYD